MAEYINVTTLNLLAKQVLEQCEPLNNLIVCGEVSNFTRHYKSGHCYFTLKDENAAIKCVMFRDKARLLGFAPENGMLVLAYGRATLYERDGAFQLYCFLPKACLMLTTNARCRLCRSVSGWSHPKPVRHCRM